MVTPINSASQAGTNTSPRLQFLEGLSPRLTTLRAMVDALVTERTTNTVESLVRRLRAMRAAADAVGLEEIGAEFDVCAATLTNKQWSAAVRSELLDRLNVVDRLGQRAPRELEVRPSGAAPRPTNHKGATPVGPFNVVALASESQKVILRQALEQADEFNLYCTQDAGEAAALLATYDPDLFVIDGRRADVAKVLEACDGSAVMVVDARAPDVDKFREGGARWVTTVGEHYETELLEGLRHRRRSQSMIAPRGEDTVTLATFAEEVAREVRQALLNTAAGSSGETPLSIGEATSVQTAVWSMLARLRDTVSELSHGAIKYDPHTPSGAMIVTGKDAMRRGGTRASAENLAGRKVLVAEDDTSVGWYLTSLLRGKGAIVVEAADGLEALRQARRDAPDLVICDVLLPALDGFALCRNLKHDVALSDVPVILLSWKEDLLQRVRELGAGADGYLAKEAEASVIVERCAEALEPRSRIEKRLLVERVVHGRLDGITPRLVLHLASRAVDNAKVVLQDAAFTYEVCLGDGRILTARRKAADGSVESGEKVLPGLLGMRAGRFTVERIREHVQAELYGSVDKVLAPYIERARRATRRLKGADLYDVSRLEIDTTALQPYLSVSPPIVNNIVERLRDGAAPGQLLHSVSASLLESVLEDLALRGGILKALDTDGDDLLDEGQRDSVAAFDVELRAGQALPVQAASGAPVIGRGSTVEDAAAAAEFAEQVNGSSSTHRQSSPPSTPPSQRPSHAPVMVAGPSRKPVRVDFEDERNSSIPPSVERSTVLGVAPEAPRPERISAMPPLPQATLTRDDEEPRGENAIPTLRPPPDDHTPPSGMKWSAPPVPRDTDFDALTGLGTKANDAGNASDESSEDALARTLGGWTPVEARVSRREEVGRIVLDADDSGIDLADAVIGFGGTPTPAQVQVGRRPAVRVSGGDAEPSETTVGPAAKESGTLTGLGALPALEDVKRTEPSSSLFDSWRAPSLGSTTPGIGPSLRDVEDDEANVAKAIEAKGMAKSLLERKTVEVESPPPKVVISDDDITPPSSPAVAPVPEEKSTPAVGASPLTASLDVEIPVRPMAPPSVPPAAEAPFEPSWTALRRDDGRFDDKRSDDKRSDDKRFDIEDARLTNKAKRAGNETDEDQVEEGVEEELPPLPVNDRGEWVQRIGAGLRPVGVVTAAALAAFLGMNQVAKWLAPEAEPGAMPPASLAVTAQPSVDIGPERADLIAAPPGEEAVVAARKTVANRLELPLPEGLTVPQGKGLLEVDSGGQHKLYVDNVFVGRGPLRRIPIDPGTHQLQTQLDGIEEVHSVDVVAGRRVRLELTESK